MTNDPLIARHPDLLSEQLAVEREQGALFRANRVALTRLAFLLTGSTAVAEELVQDAFEQVVRRWSQVERPGGYLRVAVVHGARSLGRRRPVPVEGPAESVRIDEEAVAVRDALAALPYQQREAIVLRFYAGMTDTEIAGHLDQPLGTVKSNIRRGLIRMKEVFA